MVVYNLAAVIMVLAAVAIAAGVGLGLGFIGWVPLGLIAGGLLVLFDGLYRYKSKNGHWFLPRGGGAIFWLPVWLFGLLIIGVCLWARFG